MGQAVVRVAAGDRGGLTVVLADHMGLDILELGDPPDQSETLERKDLPGQSEWLDQLDSLDHKDPVDRKDPMEHWDQLDLLGLQ